MTMEEVPQVFLNIQTDLYRTADFLRDLANAIEDEGTDLIEMETAIGMAEVVWPAEAFEDDDKETGDEETQTGEEMTVAERIHDVVMLTGDICKIETALSLFGKPVFVDEKISDGIPDFRDDGDQYVMMRSYDVDKYYVRVYYGNNTGEITDVEITEN